MKNTSFNTYIHAAKYYDYDNRDNLTVDIPFYLEYAEKTQGRILELGCGTGRVCLQKGGVTGWIIVLYYTLIKILKNSFSIR